MTTEQREPDNSIRLSIFKKRQDEGSFSTKRPGGFSQQYDGTLFKTLKNKRYNRQMTTMADLNGGNESFKASADFTPILSLPKKAIKEVDTQMRSHLKLLKDQDFQNLHKVLEVHKD